jgi:DNA-binding XRE family transcriptional regulator
VDKNEFKALINSIDFYNSEEFLKIIASLKHNICQNMRIARKLSKIKPDTAAQLLGLEPQSLRRIEAENDRDEFSTKVFILAVMTYKPDANFYFKKWKDNEKLLKKTVK